MIKTKYSGPLRERLQTTLLVDNFARINFMLEDEEGYDDCVADALQNTENAFLRDLLQQTQSLAIGNKAFPFSFSDPDEKTITLDDLKGKVVLVDLWFTGCSGCINFAEQFKQGVYPSLKDNPEFEVLSVCMDEKKERWLKSLQGGRYSDEHHINVYTGGLGIKHPMLVHYNISGAPFLILIDKNGRIFGRPNSGMPNEKLLALIKDALEENPN